MTTTEDFEFSGLPVPSADGLQASAPYWRGLRKHRLLLQRCEHCGTVRTPPADICYRCHGDGSSWDEIPARGAVFSWTRVWHAANASVSAQVPYVLLWVLVDESSGSRVLGNLVGDPLQDVAIGDIVTGVFQDRAEGTVLNWQRATT